MTVQPDLVDAFVDNKFLALEMLDVCSAVEVNREDLDRINERIRGSIVVLAATKALYPKEDILDSSLRAREVVKGFFEGLVELGVEND